MVSLTEKLTKAEVRPKVVRACEDLVEAEVAGKKGLSGAAIKTGYKVLKAVKPGVIREVIDRLLPEFTDAIEPLHGEAMTLSAQGGPDPAASFVAHLSDNDERAARALLSVTDRRAERAKNRTIKKTYDRLRGTAEQNVKAAVPDLARTIAPFV